MILKFQKVNQTFDSIQKKLEKLLEKNTNSQEIKEIVNSIADNLNNMQEFFNDDQPIINDNVSMIIERYDALCDEMHQQYSSHSTDELSKIKNFIFLTISKYDQQNQSSSSYKVTIKEQGNKLSKLEKINLSLSEENEKSNEMIKEFETINQQMTSENSELKEEQTNTKNELDGCLQTISMFNSQNNSMVGEYDSCKKNLEELQSKHDEVLVELEAAKKKAFESGTNQESQLKQEQLKREQVEKDFNKMETKYNEVSVYLRQEVERSTSLVQQKETTEAKYKKVKNMYYSGMKCAVVKLYLYYPRFIYLNFFYILLFRKA